MGSARREGRTLREWRTKRNGALTSAAEEEWRLRGIRPTTRTALRLNHFVVVSFTNFRE